MAETKPQRRPAAKTQRRPAATKEVATPKPSAARGRRHARIERHDARIERRTDLYDDVLRSLDEGARSAIEAMRKFAETADRVLPPSGEAPSRREELADSALEMAQRLIHTQAEFLRNVVDSAGKSLMRSKDAK